MTKDHFRFAGPFYRLDCEGLCGELFHGLHFENLFTGFDIYRGHSLMRFHQRASH